jgi:hypothetical protein
MVLLDIWFEILLSAPIPSIYQSAEREALLGIRILAFAPRSPSHSGTEALRHRGTCQKRYATPNVA